MAYEAFMLWRAEQRTALVFEKALAQPLPLKLSDLSERQREILIKVEDPGFYRHGGVDFSSPGQGMTTIPQALVKTLYFERFTPGFDKIEQSLIAYFVLDRHLSKEKQLTIFLNLVYLGESNGHSIHGFADAARIYFRKEFLDLSEDEFIGLVGMIAGPNVFHPTRHAEAYNNRVRRIRNLLSGHCQPRNVFDNLYQDCPDI